MESIIYHEERHVPRWFSWPLIALAAFAIAAGMSDDFPELRQGYASTGLAAVIFVLGVALVEVAMPKLEVTDREVRWSMSPLFRRVIPIDQVRHWAIRTYEPLNNPDSFPHVSAYSRRMWVPPMHCVEFLMENGSRISIAAEHPEKISAAIGRSKGEPVTQ
jgi:hypothetical protein